LSASDTIIDFVELAAELKTRCGKSFTYHSLWTAAVTGRIPARRDSGRWRVQRADIPVIVSQLGLVDHTSTAAA
jgi:hypothetical protein